MKTNHSAQLNTTGLSPFSSFALHPLMNVALNIGVSAALIAGLLLSCHFQEQNFFKTLQNQNEISRALATR